MSVTLRLFSIFHRALMNPRTLEPRRGVYPLLIGGIGAFSAFIVASMALIGLEAYHLPFARDFLYRRLGGPLLAALESFLF